MKYLVTFSKTVEIDKGNIDVSSAIEEAANELIKLIDPWYWKHEKIPFNVKAINIKNSPELISDKETDDY